MNFFKTVAVIVASCIVVTKASAISGLSTSEHFNNSAVLDPNGNFFLFWNFNSSHVTFEVHVKTRGYVGFGFSPNGNMYPADVIVGWVKDGVTYFKDRHTTAHAAPVIDTSQDWFLISGQENDFGTVLKFVRKIDTCDDDDIVINEATQRVIYSYHTDDPVDEASLPYHGGERRGTKSLSLLNGNKPPPSLGHEDTKVVELLAGNFIIPDDYTTYQCFGFQLPDIGGKHHMIEFEPIFTPGNEGYLHHMVVRRCQGFHPDLHMQNKKCTYTWPKEFANCSEIFLAWAAGGGPFYFPENSGYSVGAPDDYSFYVMEVHYTNFAHKVGIIDNSGIRMRLSPKLRQHDVGTFVIGSKVSLLVIPPHEQEFVNKGYCAEQCINQALHRKGIEEVKFIAALQHAHLLGAGIITKHFRNGTELEPIMHDPNYDFYFQEYRKLSREVTVKKGDSFVVECNYNSMGRSGLSFGGLSTREEMCETIVYHYPKLDLNVCNSSPDLGSVFNKTIDSLEAWSGLKTFLKNEFDWNNPEVKQNYTQLLKDVDYIHTCVGTDQHKLYSESYTYKEDGPNTPYAQPKPTCS